MDEHSAVSVEDEDRGIQECDSEQHAYFEPELQPEVSDFRGKKLWNQAKL
jgi:hypothetical protein